jgi:hypothetical protein
MAYYIAYYMLMRYVEAYHMHIIFEIGCYTKTCGEAPTLPLKTTGMSAPMRTPAGELKAEAAPSAAFAFKFAIAKLAENVLNAYSRSG